MNNQAPAQRSVDELAEQVKDRFLRFLDTFKLDVFTEESQQESEYVGQLQDMETHDRATLYVDMEHVDGNDGELRVAIEEEYYRFEPALRSAVLEFVRKHRPGYAGDNRGREFFVSFFNLATVNKLRELKTDKIGRLSSICGTVTRTSEVRPELMLGAFKCLECSTEVTGVEQQFKFTEPQICLNPACTNTNKWQLDTDKSQFVDWQRVRVQENSEEIPPGSMPTSLDVVLRAEVVEKVKAGDKVVFCGALIVVPDVTQLARAGESAVMGKTRNSRSEAGEGVRGLRALGVRDLTYKLSFIASSVQQSDVLFSSAPSAEDHSSSDAAENRDDDNAGAQEAADTMSPEEITEVEEMSRDPQLYSKLVKSVCPTVFGHEEVKRGVLLMLMGGVHKRTAEGMKLRGDINVCIVGDPSTAKSQFLKFVHSFLPRSVYTSGKASSAAGLTAAISRDPDTGEFQVEAGALMLADNGICCIDEFEKMDPQDMVAIHEAMEQQTISITKAGIQATLNARTSILAAANPLYGRYDRSKTLKANVNLSAPVMSRFDLFFVVVDECDEAADYNIANHIVGVRRGRKRELSAPFTKQQLQRYVKFARTVNPAITPEAQAEMVSAYRTLRQGDSGGSNKSAYRITVRQLESMVRLSEALARLHLDDKVTVEYVREAARLLQKSIIHVHTEDVVLSSGAIQARRAAEAAAEGGDDDEGEGIKITFERYQLIANCLAGHLRGRELSGETDRAEDGGMDDDEEELGMKLEDLINWFLANQDIANQDQLEQETAVVRQVVDRLIKQDNVLVFADEAKEGVPEDERLVAVHPNYEVTPNYGGAPPTTAATDSSSV